MDCREARERLQDRIDERLDDETAAALRSHLDDCAACVGLLESLRRTAALVRDLPRESAPPSLRTDVMERVRSGRPAGRRLELPLAVLGIAAAAALLLVAVVLFVPGSADDGAGREIQVVDATRSEESPAGDAFAAQAESRRTAAAEETADRGAEVDEIAEGAAAVPEAEKDAEDRVEEGMLRDARETAESVPETVESALKKEVPRGSPPDEPAARALAKPEREDMEDREEDGRRPPGEAKRRDVGILVVSVSDPGTVAARVRLLVDPENLVVLDRLGVLGESRGVGGAAAGGGSGARRAFDLGDRSRRDAADPPVADDAGSAPPAVPVVGARAGAGRAAKDGPPAAEPAKVERPVPGDDVTPGKPASGRVAGAPGVTARTPGVTARTKEALARQTIEITLTPVEARRLVAILDAQVRLADRSRWPVPSRGWAPSGTPGSP